MSGFYVFPNERSDKIQPKLVPSNKTQYILINLSSQYGRPLRQKMFWYNFITW